MLKAMEWKVYGSEELAEREWNGWFATPGDMDDFIFYWDDEDSQSETS